MSVSKSQLAFWLIVSFGIVVSFLGYYFLPDRFFNDTKTIIFDPYNEIGLIGSYPLTIWFYKVTGLKYLHFSIIGFIQFVIATILIVKIGIPKKFHILNITNIITYLCFIMLAIFLSMPTKEFITFLFMALIILLIKRSKKFILTIISITLLLFLFGVFYRPYYLVVLFISLIIYLISKTNIKNKKWATFVYGISILIFISLSYGAVKGEFISQKTRENYNDWRKGKQSDNSAIVSPVKTDTWYGESFGIVYGFISVNFPVNSIKYIKSPQILAFGIWQMILLLLLVREYERCNRKQKNNKIEIWSFYILFSFFIIQGVFEPDLGSAVRHKMGVFPLIYFTLFNGKFIEKN